MSGICGHSSPEGVLIYALSDIHGRKDLLLRLLGDIEKDAQSVGGERRLLVFMGDYIDRGADSAGVVDTLLAGLPDGFESVFLMGNHEDILLEFAAHGRNIDHWFSNGAETTLASYGVDIHADAWMRPEPDKARAEFLAALPQAHLDFYRGLGLSHSEGGYFFAHAGVRPGVPLEEQDRHDLLWIRAPFLYSEEDFGKMVVHGHTPGDEPVVRRNRICIDTRAWQSGRLTALRLWGAERRFLATG